MPTPTSALRDIIDPALQLLPGWQDTVAARILLIAIGLQESGLKYRTQLGGPARGYWQFERGTPTTRGGVTGVAMHPATHALFSELCTQRNVPSAPLTLCIDAAYDRLATDDVLAAAVARLMMATDSAPLPARGDVDGAWAFYMRVWRPGRPRRKTWAGYYAQALEAVS